MRCAYVTLVMRGNFYLPGALVLAHSLRRTGTSHDVVCMVTEDVEATAALEQVFDRVVRVDYICGDHHPFPDAKTMRKYAFWEHAALTQHRCLGLVEYGRVCFLDADVVVLRNMDSVFDLQPPAGTFYERIPLGREKHTDLVHGERVSAPYIIECLHKGLHVCIGNCLVLAPGAGVYRLFLDFLADFYRDHGGRYGFEGWNAHINEQMIAYFYAHAGIDWTQIGLAYQTVPWKYVDPDTPPFLYHYMSSTKPWEVPKHAFCADWWNACTLMLKEHPTLRQHITQRRVGQQNVAMCLRLQVPPGTKYRLRAKIDRLTPLSQRIRLLNRKTGARTSMMWMTAGEAPRPMGLSVLPYAGDPRLLVTAEAELRALFQTDCADLHPFHGKRGLVALFWPSVPEEVTSLQEAIAKLQSCKTLVQLLISVYVPQLARALRLPKDVILHSAFEMIHYQAVPFAGLEQHVDNVTRTQGILGPVCSIGLVTERCMDLLPHTGPGTPVRVWTMPGDLLILDSDARIRWSHSMPYDCTYERYSMVIRPLMQPKQAGMLNTDVALNVPVYLPIDDQPPGTRMESLAAFAHLGVPWLDCTNMEREYVTWPWAAWERNAFLVSRLGETPAIWDVFAGIGGDTLQFASLFPRARIEAVQRPTADNREERLCRNVQGRCVVHVCDASFFLLSKTEPCDLLYLDPPWCDEDERLLRPTELVTWLLRDVFHALVVVPGMVCLKTKYPWRQLRLPYVLETTISTGRGRGRFFFHCFTISVARGSDQVRC